MGQWDRFQVQRIVGSLLAAVGLFGLNAMYGQLHRNGYIRHVADILSSPKPILPGSQLPLLTQYLGLPLVDGLLALASVLWANVTDGSTPALSLYAVQFGGQLVPIFLTMMIEGSRSGNTRTAFYFSVLWGYMMQTFGYAATMPIYAALHLYTSPSFNTSGRALAKSLMPRNPASLARQVLIPAFTLGYFLPSFLMAYNFSSSTLHQWLGALWQGFPLYVMVYRSLLTRVVKQKAPPQDEQQVLHQAYDWAFTVASVAQLSTFSIIIAARAFPVLFPSWAPATFTFSNVFGPGPFYSTEPFASMATAMHDFFKWDQYVGSAAAIIWGITLDISSRKGEMSWNGCMILIWDIFRWSAIAGPGGALVRLLQRRDDTVLSEYARGQT